MLQDAVNIALRDRFNFSRCFLEASQKVPVAISTEIHISLRNAIRSLYNIKG